MSTQPLIFDIRPFSLDDGPGIRTMVFFKGCNLNCQWCHNPESINPRPVIDFTYRKCIGCGDCYTACQYQAIDIYTTDRVIHEKCTLCEKCVKVCPTNALQTIGSYYEPVDLVEILLKDRTFYETSGGGITFSGGEATLYMDYLHSVTRLLKARGIHVTIQTNGLFDFDLFSDKIIPYIDLVFFDIKIYNSDKHKIYTGSHNEVILSNFKRLINVPGITIIPRMPLIPGITDTEQNISDIRSFLHRVNGPDIVYLPFNSP